jgi:hypothetical protein
VGDSLSSDTAVAALCQLVSSMEYRIIRCDARFLGGPQYGPDRDYCDGGTANLRDQTVEERLRLASGGRNGTAYLDLEHVPTRSVDAITPMIASQNNKSDVAAPPPLPCPRVRVKFSNGFCARGGANATCPIITLEEEHGVVLFNWGGPLQRSQLLLLHRWVHAECFGAKSGGIFVHVRK